MNTFGTKIKDLRLDRNLTQKKLAEELSVTVSTLSHWECDYQEPSFDDLSKLCIFFNVEADYLLGIKPEPGTVCLETTRPSTTQELVDIFTTLPQELQTQVLEYARYFAARSKTKKKNG